MIKSFRQFLTETKVVDELGNPLLMYHGGSFTSGEFRGAGWFTSSKKDATYYAKQIDGVVTKAYLQINNPLYVGQIEHLNISPTEELLKSTERRRYEIKTNEWGFIKFIEPNVGVLIAQDLGRDGIIDLYQGKIIDAVIFDSRQIILVK